MSAEESISYESIRKRNKGPVRALSVETAQQQVRPRSGTIDSPRSLSPRNGSVIGPIIPNRSPRSPKSSSLDDSGSSSPRISPKISPQQSPRSLRTSSLGGPTAEHHPVVEMVVKPTAISSDAIGARASSQPQGIISRAGAQTQKRRTLHIHSSSGGSYDLSKLKSMLQNPSSVDDSTSSEAAPVTERPAAEQKSRRSSLARSLSASNAPIAAQVLMNPSLIVFESQIYKQNRAHRWKKRWMVLTSQSVIVYKHKDKDPSSAKVIQLSHCTARECENAADGGGDDQSNSKAAAFEVVSPDGKRHIFCGSTDGEAAVWLGMFKQVLDALLDEAILSEEKKSSTNRKTTTGLPPALLQLIVTIPECALCADCGCPDPDWASVTFGSFICIGCSGIHRSVGRNLSVVRSIMYDNWDEPSIAAMKGNKIVNEFWEKSIPENVTKPTSQSTEEEKNSWIVRKYIKREFVDPNATRRDFKPFLFAPQGVRAWLEQADELLRTIEQMQQQHLPTSAPNAAPITPSLIMARKNSVSDLRSNSASTLIATSVGKKAKKEKREKRERAASTTVNSTPSSSAPATPRKETAVAMKYASNPNLLKEALLYLIAEDEHFKRQLRTLLREPSPGQQ
eukprot:TRINITY_DN6258_c0_g1_i1.p1 TRINITY_DN6258_c0_g1~~TRINITY_DN6258_c0_g1_i1.p1  ORF type:complete len:622 (+),score=98.01 TRINITY_DN6258_c0_g1_i1:159-2024(+)